MPFSFSAEKFSDQNVDDWAELGCNVEESRSLKSYRSWSLERAFPTFLILRDLQQPHFADIVI